MQKALPRNDDPPLHRDDYVREAGPYADLVRELVESGRYASATDVVLDGLSLVQERELAGKARDAWIKAEVQKGIDEIHRGEGRPIEDVAKRLRTKYGVPRSDEAV